MVNRRTWIIGGVVTGGAAFGYYEFRKYKKQQAASQAADTETAAAAATGYGYGTPYGYGTSGGYYGYGMQGGGQGVTYGYGASGGFPAGYYGYGVPSPPSPSGPPPVAATTNAQWAQAAISQLQQDGFDAQQTAIALGAYDNGQAVSASQVNIIDAAIGIEGYPPVAGANGYPPAIKTGGTPGGGGGGGQGGGGTVKVPNVVGQREDPAEQTIRKAGLKVARNGNPGPAGREMIVTKQTPAAGKTVKTGSTVTLTVRVK